MMDWKEMLEPVISTLVQVGVLVLVAVLVQMRIIVKDYLSGLFDKVEVERGIIVDEAARRLLFEAVDVGIGSVQEMVYRRCKEPSQGELTGEEKLFKAKDAIVSYLGTQGTKLKIGDNELEDLIHARLSRLRNGKNLSELVV